MARRGNPYAFLNEERAIAKARGLCACGNVPTPGYTTCARCRAENAKRNLEHRMRKKESKRG